MRLALAFSFALLFFSIHPSAQTIDRGSASGRILRNGHILLMVEARVPSQTIVETIRQSPCVFDTFPPVMKALKARGVPNAVLEAMTNAPSGPPTEDIWKLPVTHRQPVVLTIPADTLVEVTLPSAIDPSRIREGSEITLRAARNLVLNGSTVIPRGAIATARIVELKKAKSWGRAGEVRWSLQDVIAVDGTRVPLRYEAQTRGETKGEAVAAGTVATAALAGVAIPPLAPVAALWGFVKGDEASIPAGRRFKAIVLGDVRVSATVPQAKPVARRHVKELTELGAQNPTELPRLGRESILRRW